MEELNIDQERLIAEILISVGDGTKPRFEDGWMPFDEIRRKSVDFSSDQLRDRLETACEAGTHERTEWGKNVYYRLKKM